MSASTLFQSPGNYAGLHGTSSAIDEAAEAYEGLVGELVQLAGYEASIRTILAELEKTGRGVNALEKKVIPDLVATGSGIIPGRLKKRWRRTPAIE